MSALRGGGHEINKLRMLRMGYGFMKTCASFLFAPDGGVSNYSAARCLLSFVRLTKVKVLGPAWDAGPSQSQLLIGISLRSRIEVAGNRVLDSLLAIGGGDSQVLTAAETPRLGQSLDERFRNRHVIRW